VTKEVNIARNDVPLSGFMRYPIADQFGRVSSEFIWVSLLLSLSNATPMSSGLAEGCPQSVHQVWQMPCSRLKCIVLLQGRLSMPICLLLSPKLNRKLTMNTSSKYQGVREYFIVSSGCSHGSVAGYAQGGGWWNHKP
jgi:hypothetical protein